MHLVAFHHRSCTGSCTHISPTDWVTEALCEHPRSTCHPVWLLPTLIHCCQLLASRAWRPAAFSSIGRLLGPAPDWALRSRRRVGALPLNPLRPNYRDCRRNGEEMQSYFALIEDAFNTFLWPLWPLYVSNEAESPPVGLTYIYLFVTEANNTHWSVV